jgi:hypothetical protein
MKTIVERRIEGKIRWMRIAAMLCALFAAAGIAVGIHDANPTAGWIVPIFAGIVAAAGFAIWWHVLITSVVGMVNLYAIIAVMIACTIVTALALGASAHAIATAVAGRAALAKELEGQIGGYSKALNDAYTQGTSWGSIAGAAAARAAGYIKQAETEMDGQHGTGKGCGPLCASYKDIAESFISGQGKLEALLDDAASYRKEGEAGLVTLRAAAADGDQSDFMRGTEQVNAAIAKLNAIDPRPIVQVTGGVHVTDKGIDLTGPTKEFQDQADKVLKERQFVTAPVFTPMSLGEATRSQMFGSAAHGWILAGVIDVLPLLFLFIAFLLSREVWLNETVTHTKVTKEDKKAADRKAVDDLMNPRPPGKIVPLRDNDNNSEAAE